MGTLTRRAIAEMESGLITLLTRPLQGIFARPVCNGVAACKLSSIA